MQCVADIISLWPGDQAFADDCGVAVGRIRVWRHRRFIPAEFWSLIEAAAARREIAGASASDMAALAARQRLAASVGAAAA